nr:hypothetical protein [uncultured Mediterranean phage uvMED]
MSIKNNNPGNIRSSNTKWEGMVDSKGEFVTFESPEYGIRAMTKLLQTYDKKHGLDTIKGIISRYAPPSENDTDTYIKNISSFTGFDPNQELDLDEPRVMKKLLQAIIRQENAGDNQYSDKVYNNAMSMAGLDYFDDEALGDPFDEKDSRDKRFPDLVDNDIASRSRSGLDNQSKELFEKNLDEDLGNFYRFTDIDQQIEKYNNTSALDDAYGDPNFVPSGKPVKPLSEELVGDIDYSESVDGVFKPSLQMDSGADLDDGPEPEPISLPEGYEEQGIFEYLFGDNADIDYDYEFEPDTLNLKEGGEVEADFVKTKDEQEEEEQEEEDDNDPADPPPGATPKEVADDIPAMLSEGEYVLPANVVKYIGLERIINMHRQVLCEIQEMEDLGLIQNVDENGEPEDDDEEMKFAKKPTEGVVEIIVASSPKSPSLMSKEPLNFRVGGAPGDPGEAQGSADPSGMSGPEGNVVDDMAGNPTGVAGPGSTVGKDNPVDVSGLTAVEVAIAAKAKEQGADNPRGTAKAATSMGYTGVNEFSTEKSIDEQVTEAVDARVANNPTMTQLDINAKLEKGFQKANPGITQGVGVAASLMGAIPGPIGLVSTLGNVVNAGIGEKTTAELAGINELFSGVLDGIPSVDIDVPDVVTDVLDKVGEFANTVPGNPDDTVDEPNGQKPEDPEKIEDKIEVAGEVEPTVTLDDEIFIPGVGLVKNAPRQGIMSLT